MGWETGPDGQLRYVADSTGGGNKAADVRAFNGTDGWIYYQPIGPDGRPAGSAYTLGEPIKTTGTGTGVSHSTSYNVSDLGPNSMEIQRQQNEIALQKLNADIEQSKLAAANDAIKLRYLGEQNQIQRDANKSADARASQQLMEQIQSRIESNQLSQQKMILDAQQLQASLDFQAARDNAANQIQADQINEQRRQANLEQRRGVAGDIASFSKNPGDSGALASYLLAGGAKPTALSTAMATGQDARTPQALVPLDLLLQNQDELAKGPTPFTAPTLTAPRVAIPSFQQPAQPNFNMSQPAQPGFGGGGGGQNYAAQYGAGTWNSGNANTGYVGSVDAGGNLIATPTVAAADGFNGIVDQPTFFLAGEAGPEHVNVTPQNEAVTPFSDPMNQNPGWQDMRSAPTDAPSMQDPAQPNSRPLDFLNTAYQNWLARSPWAGKGVPTPVALSSPGISPYVQQYAGAGAALKYGIDPGLYLAEARAAAPVGLSGVGARRTR